MSKRAPACQAGFTLTETLVAVALLAIVAAAAVPVLRGGADAHARLTGLAAEHQAHAALERTVRESLAAAVDAPGSTFQGGPGGLRFTAHPAGAPAPVEIAVQSQGERVIVSGARPGGGAVMSEVFEPGSGFAGFYFYGRPQDQPLGWYRAWPGPNPPRLVVLDLAPGPDGSVRRIEALVGARAGLACDYDSGLQACREGI